MQKKGVKKIRMDKVYLKIEDAIADVYDGATIAIAGFFACGVPRFLLQALIDKKVKNLTLACGCGPMVGASGAILGLLAACAILFPHFVVFILFFPVPIRVAAIGLTAVYFILVVTRAENAGGNAAHLAGMATGALYVLSKPWLDRIKLKTKAGAWEKKIAAERNLQAELDCILQKVHDLGVHSLTSKEKRILKKATELERKRSGL